ncbi:DUF2341 domain-containing protein [Candidatus Woesebacteria bacterium]|nr:MAG: DUF2341 domain-containing protein [Candidatus Woesebacteria bacterium]
MRNNTLIKKVVTTIGRLMSNTRKNRRKALAVFLSIVLILFSIRIWEFIKPKDTQAAWFDENWAYRKTITIDNAMVSGSSDLTNFPVLISLTTDADITAAQTDGDDIFFTSSDGTKLDHEIEYFSSGTLVSWVKIPTLAYAADTEIYIYYGNPGASNQENPKGVWSNSYQGVWHMSEDPSITTDGDCGGGTKELCDSTENSNDADANGTMTTADLIAGKVGNAMDMDGSNDYFTIADSPSFDIGTGNMTLSGWIYSTDTNIGVMQHSNTSDASDGWWIDVLDDGRINYSMNDSDHPSNYFTFDGNAWVYFTIVKNGTAISIYDNGALDLTDDNGQNVTNSAGSFLLGRSDNPYEDTYFAGRLDELRFSNTNRSTDWITTEYRNQNAPATYLSAGTQEKGATPVAFLKFDEGVSNTCFDGTSDACDSTVNRNSAAFGSTTAAPTWQNEDMCVSGKCIWFDGTDDVATITTSESLNLGNQLTNGFTVQGWYKPNSLGESSNGQLFYKGSATYLRLAAGSSSGVTDIQASLSLSGNSATLTIDDAIALNTWHHISMSYTDDGDDEISIYIDGILRGTSINGSGSPTEEGASPETYPIVQATNISATTSTSATTHTVSLPSGISSGDLLVIFFRTGATSTTHTLSGWNTLSTRDSTGRTTIFWKTAAGSEGATVDITTAAGRASAHNSYRITGHDTSDPIDGVFASTNTLDPASLDPGWGSSKILWLAMANTRRTDNTLTAPTDYLSIITAESAASNTSTNHVRLSSAQREYEASSENPGAFGSTGTLSAQHSALVAINPTPAVEGGSDLLLGGTTTANYHGFIDTFKAYNYERTSEQVKSDAIKNTAASGSIAILGQQSKDFLIQGLVGYWPMDETTGNPSDKSGNSTTLTNNNSTAFTAAKFGNSGELNGTSQYFEAADSAHLSVTGSLTLSAWINPDDTTGSQNIVGKWDGTNTSYLLALEGNEVRMYIDSASNYQATTALDITANIFTHVVGTYNAESQTLKIYANGVEIPSTQSGTIPSSINDNAGETVIGADDSAANYFDGHIDDVRIYNRTLSPADIQNLYNWAPGPVAYYPLDENTGTTSVGDKSANGFTGTLTSITENSWVPGNYGSGLYLDGSADFIDIGTGPTKVNTVAFWVKPVTTTEYFVNLTSTTDLISASGGTISATGLSGPTIYINGVQGTTLTAGVWQHVAVTTATAENASNFEIGRTADTNYLEGTIDDIRIYNYARTASQIVEDLNGGHPIGGSPIGSQIARYRFDEMSGDYSYDAVGSYNGNLAGSGVACPQAGVSDCPTWNTEGKINSSMEFDGSNDWIDSTIPSNVTSNVSISLWFYSHDAGSMGNSANLTQYMVTQRRSANNPRLTVGLDNNRLGMLWHDGANNAVEGTTVLSPNTWYHAFLTYNGTTINLYLNGRLEATAAESSMTSATADTFVIGDANDISSGPFDGLLDDVQIFSSVLTQDQMNLIVNANAAVNFGTGYDEQDQLEDGADATPVVYYTFDENTGTTTTYNKGSNQYHGTLTNFTEGSWVPGKYGSALDFERDSSQYISLTTDPTNVAAFTAQAWINIDAINGSDEMTIVGYVNGVGDEWTFSVATDGTLEFEDFVSSKSSTTVLAPGRWYHVAATYNYTTLNIYIDGRLDSTHAITNTFGSNGGDFEVGFRSRFGLSQYFDGLIDEVKFYNYIRTPAQIAYDYNRGKPVGWWRLDECQGSTANDASGNGNNGTITEGGSGTNSGGVGTCSSGNGDEMWDNGTTGKYHASLDFDDTDDLVSITDDEVLDLPNNISISAWVKTGGNEADNVVVSKGTQYELGINADGDVYWYNGSTTEDDASAKVLTGSWHHIAVTNNDTTTKYYVDGILTGTDTAGIGANNATNFLIGYDGTNYFDGQIDDVRIYNYVLSEDQIRQIMNFGSAYFGPAEGAP